MRLDAALMPLGRIGVWTWAFVTRPAAEVRFAARAIEDMGYAALWYPESTGREAFATASLLLEATERVVVAPGIANLWARDPTAMANGARSLGEAFPGRFLLGVGVSHAPSVARRGGAYQRPLKVMGTYLDGMEQAAYSGPEPDPAVPVVLAALGPQMLRIAGERTAGAHPYFVPVAHTEFARHALGPGPFLAPEQAVVLEADPDTARAIARRHTARYLALDNYSNNLRRLGWDEAHLRDGGSDDLVDAVVAWGDVDVIEERIAAHLVSGADHVSIQVLAPDDGFALGMLEVLAPRLLDS
jgi:probable F420-dependent oxidoreductase